MNVEHLLLCLVKTLDLSAMSVSTARWFGFGSFFLSTKHFSDVDVLAVCRTQEDGLLIHQICHELWSEWPVDLLILTEAEEASTSFIAKWNCVPLPEGIPIWRADQNAASIGASSIQQFPCSARLENGKPV